MDTVVLGYIGYKLHSDLKHVQFKSLILSDTNTFIQEIGWISCACPTIIRDKSCWARR